VNSTIEAARPSIAPELWDDFFAGSRLACARLITKVENSPELVPEIRDRLIPRLKGAVRVGITGPPGVGKSTVTAALTRRAVKAGHKIGVIAIDPTSPFTGGAFLGDRVRMQGFIGNPNVFIRSQASREGHGGLSPTTPYVADVFDAFGMDRILIETVGVGQAELDVLTCADIVVLVLQPETGDVIQALKAGIIEVADMILANKSDMPGLESLLDALKFLFDMNAKPKAKPVPPVLAASAIQDQGIDEAYTTLERLIEGRARLGFLRQKKLARLEEEIKAAVQKELWDKFQAAAGAGADIAAAAERLVDDGRSPYPYIRDLGGRIALKFLREDSHGKSKR
jgi:LAO/AO transport system kinase